MQSFIVFAEKSVVDNSDISRSCAKNAEICSESGQVQSAQTWNLLSTLFCDFSPNDVDYSSEKLPSLNLMNILLPILNYYAEISNSQMCVTMYSLFHQLLQFKEFCADRVHIWYDSYLGKCSTRLMTKIYYFEIHYIILLRC